MNGGVRTGRCGAVWAITTAAATTLLAWLAPVAVSGPSTPGFAGWLVTGSGIVGTICVTWLWVLTTAVVTDAVRGRAARRAGVPGAVRRLVLVACGATLASGLLAPAHADQSDRGRAVEPGPRPAATAALLVGLPIPDRTTTTTQWLGQLATSHDRVRRAPGGSLVVARGDSLWGIAARTLSVHADDNEIERRWREIYRANRDVVGADPDLIRPGQRLVVPDPPENDL